ncbi:hypothetical protein HDV02_002554 [Globomyces sp. JEL0801]|nr:hypothetical protein HDV02_002554 [Globomyces sp. JEL0801]
MSVESQLDTNGFIPGSLQHKTIRKTTEQTINIANEFVFSILNPKSISVIPKKQLKTQNFHVLDQFGSVQDISFTTQDLLSNKKWRTTANSLSIQRTGKSLRSIVSCLPKLRPKHSCHAKLYLNAIHNESLTPITLNIQEIENESSMCLENVSQNLSFVSNQSIDDTSVFKQYSASNRPTSSVLNSPKSTGNMSDSKLVDNMMNDKNTIDISHSISDNRLSGETSFIQEVSETVDMHSNTMPLLHTDNNEHNANARRTAPRKWKGKPKAQKVNVMYQNNQIGYYQEKKNCLEVYQKLDPQLTPLEVLDAGLVGPKDIYKGLIHIDRKRKPIIYIKREDTPIVVKESTVYKRAISTNLLHLETMVAKEKKEDQNFKSRFRDAFHSNLRKNNLTDPKSKTKCWWSKEEYLDMRHRRKYTLKPKIPKDYMSLEPSTIRALSPLKENDINSNDVQSFASELQINDHESTAGLDNLQQNKKLGNTSFTNQQSKSLPSVGERKTSSKSSKRISKSFVNVMPKLS